MIDADSQKLLRREIAKCIDSTQSALEVLRGEIRPLADVTHPIKGRETTSISLVATDGGNNQLYFDPFLIQLVRVVDSSNNEYCMEAIAPTMSQQYLTDRQFDRDGTPRTALGEMMQFLGVSHLSQFIHETGMADPQQPLSLRWIKRYRELVEWAVLFRILKKDFGSDTLIIFDGLLRSIAFTGDLFQDLLRGMQERIDAQWRKSRRRIYLVGIAKNSKILSRYRLAMALEKILHKNYPAYAEVPNNIEEKTYGNYGFARGGDDSDDGIVNKKYAGGKMFLVKFGTRSRDPIWPIDIFAPQVKAHSPAILGGLLHDARNGFPVLHYPRCLQKAHENAALVDFDFDILQNILYEGMRTTLGDDAVVLDAFQLQDSNPAQMRYK